MVTKIYTISILVILFISCGKNNPEDPLLPKFSHMNERLDGEWELTGLYIDGKDSSEYLNIDTMNIATYFKFEPTDYVGDVEGWGNLFIKSKTMAEYPDRIGISQSGIGDLNDTNVATAKIRYHFREGTKEGDDFFVLDFADMIAIDELTSDIVVFKPFDNYLKFNNFYIQPSGQYGIVKSTKNKFILKMGTALKPFDSYSKIKYYRFEFTKK